MAGTVIFDILAKDRASEVFKHVGREAKKTGDELEGLGARGGAAMGKLAHAGKAALLGVAGVAAVTGVVALKMAANFQAQTSVLQTAAGETAAGLKVVRKGILDIAQSTGTTWQNLTDGMYQVEKAGYRGAEGLKVLNAAAQGAKEENANLSTVTNAMTSVMASYHLGADKSVQVMNALKTAAAGSKDTMQNFAASLSSVLPFASAAHISFAQVGGAMAGLTRHGTSAAEATQELANTIRNLHAPGAKAIKQMEQFGISSTDVSLNLGKRGIAGTLEYLVGVISKKMGPSGLIMQDTFKKSKSAAQDLQTMLAHMGKPARDLADEFLSNTITLSQYHKGMKKLPEDQTVMAKQFARLAAQASGFSDALRKGNPQATTMSNLLKTMLGGSTGLNTALMLTGENQAYVNDMTKRTAASMGDNAKSVEGWAQTQKLFNTRLDSLKQTVDVLGISLGTKLMPYAEKLVKKLQDGLAPGSKFRDVLSHLGKAAGDFGKDAKPIFSWIGDHPNLFTQIAKDAVILVGALKAKAFLTGMGLLKGGGGLGIGGIGGAASMARPVPVFVTNQGFGGGIGGKGGPTGIVGSAEKGAVTAAEAAGGAKFLRFGSRFVGGADVLSGAGITGLAGGLMMPGIFPDAKNGDAAVNKLPHMQRLLASQVLGAARGGRITGAQANSAMSGFHIDTKTGAVDLAAGYDWLKKYGDKSKEVADFEKDPAVLNALRQRAAGTRHLTDLLSGGLLSAANNAARLKHNLDALHDKKITVTLNMPSALASSAASGVHDRMPGGTAVPPIVAHFHGNVVANNPQDLLLSIMSQNRVGAISGSSGFVARHG